MSECNYDIQFAWPDLQEEPVDIARKFLLTLDAVGRIDPIFNDWGVPVAPDSFEGRSIDEVRANFKQHVEANVQRDDDDQPNPDDGYSVLAATRFRTEKHSESFSLSVNAGSKWRNYISLSAGHGRTPPPPEMITYPTFKAALLAMLSIWPAPWANVRSYIWGQRPSAGPGEPPFPYSGYQMPWMAYLCAERAAHLEIPTGILSERTPDGGLLMIAAETRFDPTDREHMARSRILAEILIEHGGNPNA